MSQPDDTSNLDSRSRNPGAMEKRTLMDHMTISPVSRDNAAKTSSTLCDIPSPSTYPNLNLLEQCTIASSNVTNHFQNLTSQPHPLSVESNDILPSIGQPPTTLVNFHNSNISTPWNTSHGHDYDIDMRPVHYPFPLNIRHNIPEPRLTKTSPRASYLMNTPRNHIRQDQRPRFLIPLKSEDPQSVSRMPYGLYQGNMIDGLQDGGYKTIPTGAGLIKSQQNPDPKLMNYINRSSLQPASYPMIGSSPLLFAPIVPPYMVRVPNPQAYPEIYNPSLETQRFYSPPPFRFQSVVSAPEPTLSRSVTLPSSSLSASGNMGNANQTPVCETSGSSAFENLQRWAQNVLSHIDKPLSAKDLNDVDNEGETVDKSMSNRSRIPSVDSGLGSGFSSRDGTPIESIESTPNDTDSINCVGACLRHINAQQESCINQHATPDSRGHTSQKITSRSIKRRQTRKRKLKLKPDQKRSSDDIQAATYTEDLRAKRRRRRMLRNNINHFYQPTSPNIVKQRCLSRCTHTVQSYDYVFMSPYKISHEFTAFSCKVKNPRKQLSPRRSPALNETGFRGVTLNMRTVITPDADTYLSVQAFFSSRRLRTLHERFNHQRAMACCRPKGYYNYVTETHRPYTRYKTPPSNQGGSKQCASCGTRRTPLWRDAEDGTPLCNACGIRYKKYRVRCLNCSFIPRKEGKSALYCLQCGSPFKPPPSIRTKMW